MKVAIFDFCGTLVKFQTADSFVDYVRARESRYYMKVLEAIHWFMWKSKLISLSNKIFPLSRIGKRIKLLQLRGIDLRRMESYAEEYYFEKIRPNLIKEVLIELKELKNKNFQNCIVSAGYSIYLKYFAEEFAVPHLIASEIDFNPANGKCNGRLLGPDCYHNEKVKMFHKHFKGMNLDYSESISYSDSITDLPLLKITGSAVIVSKYHSQQWINKYSFREIIWE